MFTRYVALGDSQTEGMNDPDGAGGYVGWADRFAALLAAHNPGLGYANLAIRGRRTPAIRQAQLGPAIALQPDLATVMAGVNDILGADYDVNSVAADIEAMYSGLTEAGAVVMGCTFPDIGRTFSLAGRLSPRIKALNAAIREAAGRHNVLLVEFAQHPALNDARLWSHDRLHLNPFGHARTAVAFAHRLGVTTDESWYAPLPPMTPAPTWRRKAEDVEWIARYFLPWMGRHLTGRSTGDGRSPKRPTLLPLATKAFAAERATS
jgi:lysophospholipase L1-like esterase